MSMKTLYERLGGLTPGVHELIAEENRVVGHLSPLPPSGKRVQFEEIVILQIRDGNVRRQRGIPAQRAEAARRRADTTVVTGPPWRATIYTGGM